MEIWLKARGLMENRYLSILHRNNRLLCVLCGSVVKDVSYVSE